jgi:tripartite ATP-independent transporter DctM subunit
MEGYLLPLLMVAALLAGIFSGYPVAFLLGGLSILFTLIAGIPVAYLNIVVSRIFTGNLANWLLLAVPLFVFMGLMLEKSGAAQNLLRTLEMLFAGRRGGLAISVAVLGIVMAAATGIIGASVVLLGVMALPVMLNQGYDKKLAAGTIMSAGCLGILIPPSIMLVLVGDILSISVGDLFMGAMIPGLLLGVLYVVYIIITVLIYPEKAPAHRGESLRGLELVTRLIRDLLAPGLLIAGVLGSIVAGIATPTEAAAIGAAGTILIAAATRQLTWANLRESVLETGLTTAMVIFVALGATAFSAVFKRLGGDRMIEDAVFSFGTGPYLTLGVIMLLIFVLGFFLEWIEISFVVLPLFGPIVAGMDFGLGLSSEEILLWFAILVAVNLQTSFLTPPFGYALFYLRGIAPPGLTIGDIYRSSIPFVGVQLLCFMILFLFPQIVLWLPRTLIGVQ